MLRVRVFNMNTRHSMRWLEERQLTESLLTKSVIRVTVDFGRATARRLGQLLGQNGRWAVVRCQAAIGGRPAVQKLMALSGSFLIW